MLPPLRTVEKKFNLNLEFQVTSKKLPVIQ